MKMNLSKYFIALKQCNDMRQIRMLRNISISSIATIFFVVLLLDLLLYSLIMYLYPEFVFIFIFEIIGQIIGSIFYILFVLVLVAVIISISRRIFYTLKNILKYHIN